MMPRSHFVTLNLFQHRPRDRAKSDEILNQVQDDDNIRELAS